MHNVKNKISYRTQSKEGKGLFGGMHTDRINVASIGKAINASLKQVITSCRGVPII
jgi:hypothetical protein